MSISVESSVSSIDNYESNINLSKWINDFHIDDDTKKAICFRENLIVHSKHGQCKSSTAIGGYCISVDPVENGQSKLLIHVSSSLTVKGQFGGSKLVSSTTLDLSCLEENRTEYLYTCNGYHEKSLAINLNEKGDTYHIKINKTCPCNTMKNDFDMSVCQCNKLLCEGANIVLSRYLAIKNFSGTFTLQNVNEEGRIIYCDYRCTAAECKVMYGRCLDIYTVERRMIYDYKVQIIVTYMNTNGRILRHDWQSLPYILEINPLIHPSFSANTSSWEDDIQMMADYLGENKEKSNYMADHPEMKSLITDYVKTLLAVKPAEILTFALKHILNATKDTDINKHSIFDGKKLKSDMRRICNLCGICVDTEPPQYEEKKIEPCFIDTACKTVCEESDEDIGEDCYCEATDSDLSSERLSICDAKPDCEDKCAGCQVIDRAILQPCGEGTNCQDTCEGCKVVDKSELAPCAGIRDCADTCLGCKKRKLKPCDEDKNCSEISPECQVTKFESCDLETDFAQICAGCQFTKLEKCDMKDNCSKTCEGCTKAKPISQEPCEINNDCADACACCT